MQEAEIKTKFTYGFVNTGSKVLIDEEKNLFHFNTNGQKLPTILP